MQDKVTIGRQGVITIPAKLREALGLKENDELLIEDTHDGLLLRPSINVPVEMYSEERIAEFSSDEEAIGKVLDRKKQGPASP